MTKVKKTLLVTLASINILAAASTPNIGNIVKEVPKNIIQDKKQGLVEISGIKKYPALMKDDKSNKKILVKSFLIQGAVHISQEYLQTLISSYKNKKLSFQEIKNVASLLTKEYRKQGYFVARAYIPVQDMKNGIVKLVVMEGNYGNFKLNNTSGIKDSIILSHFNEAKKNTIVSSDSLQRSMFIINDTPGAFISGVDVLPGSIVGSSDFLITTETSKAYDGYLIADNLGSRYTGYYRLMAGINVNSPFKIGDKLSFNTLLSDGAHLKNGSISYSAPLMPNGLRAQLSYSHTAYDLTQEYQSLEAKGSAKVFDFTLSYPIKRTANENLNVSLNLANKSFKDAIQSTSDETLKKARVMNLSLAYNKNTSFFGFDSNNILNVIYTLGSLKFEDATKRASDVAGANTNGRYSKIAFTLSKNISFSNKVSLESAFKYQHALGNKNLDGSEDISIGGDYGVKVYPSGELSAENGYVFNIEAKYALDTIKNISNQVGVFYDRGKAYMANNTVGFESRSIQDIGFSHYASYKNFSTKTQVAWTLNSETPSELKAGNSRILFQGIWSF